MCASEPRVHLTVRVMSRTRPRTMASLRRRDLRANSRWRPDLRRVGGGVAHTHVTVLVKAYEAAGLRMHAA